MAHFDHLAQPAARRARAARVRAELLALEAQRRLGLEDFQRHIAHAAGVGGDRKPVLARARARAPGRETDRIEARAVAQRGVVLGTRAAQALAAHQLQVPQRRCAFGRNQIGTRLAQRAEHHVGQQLADHMARRDRGRVQRVEDAAFGRSDADRRQRAGVVGHIGADQAAHAKRGIGVGIGLGHIDAARHRARGAAEVHVDAVVGDGDAGRERDRRVVAVGHQRVVPHAPRPLRKRVAHGARRLRNDVVAQRLEVVQRELLHQHLQPPAADFVAGDQREQVAFDLGRIAHIGMDDGQHRRVHLAGANEAQDGQEQPLVVDLQAVGA